jgi:hypothetical protein
VSWWVSSLKAILIGGFYFFDPVAKLSISNNVNYLLWSVPAVFLAGFGMSLQFTLRTQLWQGKWN